MGSVTHGENKKKKSGWDGRRKMVSAVAALMALLFLIPLVMEIFQYAGAVTLDEISSLNAQQEELEEKKSDLQSQLDDLKDQENSAVSRCNLLSEKINVLEDQIATTQGVVDEYADQIKENQKILKKAKQEEADYYDLFCQRVRSMEENGTTSYWQILFGASGFSDFLDRVSFVSSVMAYDDSVLTNLEEARESVAQATEELQEKKAAKEKALNDLEEQQTQVSTASKEAVKTLKEIKDNQDVYAEEMSEIDAMADELAADIVSAKSDYAAEQKAAAEKAKAEQKAAEEAAKREAEEKKATEEAAKKAAEQQAAASEANDANNSNSSNDSNDSDQAKEETPAEEPEEEQKSDSSSGSSGSGSAGTSGGTSSSASGAAIVNYAMQFIGGRYVWGGANLSTGVDCSGFVMCVYAHYGYSLPHSSAALAGCGKGVSYSNAQLGDIICYKGHCGIYIGGGMMVNALGVKYGIVVNKVNTSRLVAVRRII